MSSCKVQNVFSLEYFEESSVLKKYVSLPQYRIDHRCLRRSRFSRPRFAFTAQCTSRKLVNTEMLVKAFERGHEAPYLQFSPYLAIFMQLQMCMARPEGEARFAGVCNLGVPHDDDLVKTPFNPVSRPSTTLAQNIFPTYFPLCNICNDVERGFF